MECQSSGQLHLTLLVIQSNFNMLQDFQLLPCPYACPQDPSTINRKKFKFLAHFPRLQYKISTSYSQMNFELPQPMLCFQSSLFQHFVEIPHICQALLKY